MLLVGQLGEDELLADSLEDDSPEDEVDPPPLQEITRRLKLNTTRKKRSFLIYFP